MLSLMIVFYVFIENVIKVHYYCLSTTEVGPNCTYALQYYIVPATWKTLEFRRI
jgi:hypothetical protein